jgi:Domain of unknown function (DUF4440)
MKKFAALIFIIFAAAQGLLAQIDNKALHEEILKLELAHAGAIFRGNAAALDSLMDDSITVNHPTNRIVNEKKELLDLIRQGIIRYTSFERYPEKFIYFNDMVVVMGRETVVPARTAPNAGKTLHRRYTDVWLKRDGKWLLTIRHANNICD